MLLALDLGTTNVKALVTDRLGHSLARGACPVHLSYVENGGVEQDSEEIWQAALAAIRQAVVSVEAAAVEAIGISSQGGAMQVLDAGRRPLGPVISWLDQRGRPFDDALTAELGRKWFLEHIAHGRSGFAIGQVLRLGRQQPGQITPANSIGFVGDLVAARLCGRAAQDGTSAGLTLFYDPKSRAYDSDLLQRLGLAANQLPVLVSPREPAGPSLAGSRPGCRFAGGHSCLGRGARSICLGARLRGGEGRGGHGGHRHGLGLARGD